MESSKRESRVVVVKYRTLPVCEIVAGVASCREACGCVRRRIRTVVIRLVAGDARGGRRERIGSARAERGVVALGALHGRVEAAQRETRCGVIKGCAQPVGGRVALVAGRREAGLHVAWIRCAVEVGLVARDAGRVVRQVIRTGGAECRVVALRTLQGGMEACQREPRTCMVESRAQPVGRGVALTAGRRETRLHVVRIGRVVEIGLVASDALRVIRQIVGARRAERGVVALRAL